jgi:anti-sigma regulatory factor (Ser/Thr protein kinase)
MNVAVEREAARGLRERIAGGPAAAITAREMLCRLVGNTSPESTTHDALLLTTELVTNAVRHAGVGEDKALELCAEVTSKAIRVSVTDPGSDTTPRVQELNVEKPGGMGLFLVEQLSSSWGVERTDGANEVWFELRLPRRFD